MQRTIAREAAVRGIGFLSERDVRLRFRPAEAGTGMKGFRSAGAFATLDSRWEASIRYVGVELMGKFAQDLRDAAAHFTTTDGANASSFH